MTRLRQTAAAITVIAAAAFLPASARAGEVVLWACHGPHGEALGAVPFVSAMGGDGRATTYGNGCEGGEGVTGEEGGLSATFSAPDPAGKSEALWQLYVPSGVALHSLRIARSTTGFGGEPVSSDPQIYEASTSSGVVESAALDEPLTDKSLGGELVREAMGSFVRVSVSCALGGGQSCPAPSEGGTVGVEVSSVALGVRDEAPPTGAVGGVRSPVEPGATLELLLDASDSGLGLANAEASIEGRTVAFVRLGTGSCPEHPSLSETIEMPLGAAGCPGSVSEVPLSVPVGGAGLHRLRVTVTDAAGNTTTLVDQTIAVESPPPSGSNTITVDIGNAGSPSAGSAAGGVLGTSFNGTPVACQLPVLTMKLVSKPLRYAKVGRHRVPVLLARRHYVYRGALTCLVNNHRVSAPTGTVVHVLDEVGRRLLKSGRGTMTVHKGALKAILGYTSARTIIFRYGPVDGELVQVKLPIEIGRKRANTTHARAKTMKGGPR
jgi:hypothetical protein